MSQDQKDFQRLSSTEYRRVFDEYYSAIRTYLYFKTSDNELAEDLAQDTFVKLWDNRDRINLKTVKSYLYTIAGNLAINQLKRNQLKYKFINQVEKRKNDMSPEYLLEMKEFDEKLQSVLAEIPEGAREVFLMNRIEGLKYHEISERIGIGVKAVEKRMSKALKIIRERLDVNV